LALTVGAEEVNPGIQVAADKVDVVNVATITNTAPVSMLRPDPTTTQVVARDATSITNTGIRPRELATFWYDWGDQPAYLQTRAAELLSTTEAPRIPTLPLDPLTMSTAQQSAVLAADVWELIAVTGLPTAGGWVTNWLGRVEGWSETVGATQWDITFNTSFAGARVGDSTFAVVGTMRLG
jgi:hypothetical protein